MRASESRLPAISRTSLFDIEINDAATIQKLLAADVFGQNVVYTYLYVTQLPGESWVGAS